ncbi:MAG: hypothetical protein GY934_07295 [Gammaproteobacteria bacterium]|nr:hypothetical protein [Gammaproteobacteria bacterium]
MHLFAKILPVFFLLYGSLAAAVSRDVSGDSSTDRLFERIWQAPKLYEDNHAPTLQSLSLIGRYHGQQWGVDLD